MTDRPASLRDAAARIARRELTAADLTEGCLNRIAAGNDALRPFITVMADQARADAARADAEIAAGRYRGPLHGMPISVKDLVDIVGTPTTSGSNVPPRHPAHDAPVIANLRRAGAVIVGKTNLHEFAFGTTTDETAFGAVRNPHDRTRSAGGSSAGAAVALVEGMCYGSVGTDTGGSIRIPAAACGVTGLKPGYGEISTDGVVPLSTSLDHLGPLALDVQDAALLYHAMASGEAREDRLPGETKTSRLGVPTPYFLDKLDAGTRDVFTRVRSSLATGGHTVTDVSIAHAERTADVYLHIVLPEASWYHAPLLERYADRYAPGVRLRLEMGRYVTAEDYLRAQHARDVLRQSVDAALEGVDALLLPAMPIGAPTLGASTVDIEGRKEPVRAIMLRLTQLFNITGHPAIAVPCGAATDGLPRAIQLVGRRRGTDRLIAIASAIERQMIGGAGSVGGGAG
jgi:aspartyl-tRNA(Asn)/glutamyl-tRNA(Gln) amidotransferase subunit A